MSNSIKRLGFLRNQFNHVHGTQVPAPTFSISESANDTAVAYTIDTNKPNQNLFYSSGGNATANDFSDNTLTGNISLDANGNATLVRTVTSNNIGLSRTFSTDIRINSVTGRIIYPGNTFNIIDNEMVTVNDINDDQKIVLANITLQGQAYQQLQFTQLPLAIPGYSSNLEVYYAELSPGAGPSSNVDVLVIGAGGPGGFAYGNSTVSFNTSGGGGGGGGEVVQTTLLYNSGANANLSITLPSSNLIPTTNRVGDPGNANTIISNLNIMSSSNPANIVAIHGGPGLDGDATTGGNGGDGGGPGPSSSSSKRGAGGAGGKATSPATSFGQGGDFGGFDGGPGANARDIIPEFRTNLYKSSYVSYSGGGAFQGINQLSTTGSGTGAVFDVTLVKQLNENRIPPNMQDLPSVTVAREYAGLDPANQKYGTISINGASNDGTTVGQGGAGYAVGDLITLDGAECGGATGTNDIVLEVRNIKTSAGPGHSAGAILWGTSSSTQLGLKYISGTSTDIFLNDAIPVQYVSLSSPGTVEWPIAPPYQITDPASFNASTYWNQFGGGGGVSTLNLSGGIAYSGSGFLGQGGKGEHFRNTGSNIDMFATGGLGGAVILRWLAFAPFRSIEIS